MLAIQCYLIWLKYDAYTPLDVHQADLDDQGSAQAIEDAAMLGTLLQELKEDPEEAARLYHALRHDRATKIQQFARAQRKRNHLPDGLA